MNYRKRMIAGVVLLLLVLGYYPFFFQSIENREGAALNDWILNVLPAVDLSLPIFLVIWSTLALLIIRALRDPQMALQYLWSYFFLCVLRIITISLVKLDPPAGLLPLADPVSNLFYGQHFVTRDLFFSGHTATVFMMFLCLKRKADKIFALTASVITALFLLMQHVHYTIDVLAAPLFCYLVYLATKRIFCTNGDSLTTA
jgi:PAP2 superfamily C-terminal